MHKPAAIPLKRQSYLLGYIMGPSIRLAILHSASASKANSLLVTSLSPDASELKGAIVSVIVACKRCPGSHDQPHNGINQRIQSTRQDSIAPTPPPMVAATLRESNFVRSFLPCQRARKSLGPEGLDTLPLVCTPW